MKQNPKFELYEKLAEEGNVKCQFILADSYLEGSGVKKNKRKALKYYKLLADQSPENRDFLKKSKYFDDGHIYSRVATLLFNSGNIEEADYYLTKSLNYFLKNYSREEANFILKKLSMPDRVIYFYRMKKRFKGRNIRFHWYLFVKKISVKFKDFFSQDSLQNFVSAQ